MFNALAASIVVVLAGYTPGPEHIGANVPHTYETVVPTIDEDAQILMCWGEGAECVSNAHTYRNEEP